MAQSTGTDTNTTGEIIRADIYRTIDKDALRTAASFKDVMALFSDAGAAGDSITDYGDGFVPVENKRDLERVPFVILTWSYGVSDTYRDPETGEPGEYAVARIVTEDGRKLIMVDGSTGIRAQLRDVEQRRVKRGMPVDALLRVPRGLRSSTYDLPDGSGVGTTFYLSE